MYEYNKQLKKKSMPGKTIQRFCICKYTPKKLKCISPIDGSIVTTLTGIDSQVTIDGSVTPEGTPPYPGRDGIYEFLDGYKKGHIVNQLLGGKGIPVNLFPFSAGTNSWHEKHIEHGAKQAYINYLNNHQEGETYSYHCWLTGEAIRKSCLDYPKEVDNIEIHGEYHINTPGSKPKSIHTSRSSSYVFDPDFDGSRIPISLGPSMYRQRVSDEKARISKRLAGLNILDSSAYKALTMMYGTNITQTDLLYVATCISHMLDIHIDRDARRQKKALIAWFVENWPSIEPIFGAFAPKLYEAQDSI